MMALPKGGKHFNFVRLAIRHVQTKKFLFSSAPLLNVPKVQKSRLLLTHVGEIKLFARGSKPRSEKSSLLKNFNDACSRCSRNFTISIRVNAAVESKFRENDVGL